MDSISPELLSIIQKVTSMIIDTISEDNLQSPSFTLYLLSFVFPLFSSITLSLLHSIKNEKSEYYCTPNHEDAVKIMECCNMLIKRIEVIHSHYAINAHLEFLQSMLCNIIMSQQPQFSFDCPFSLVQRGFNNYYLSLLSYHYQHQNLFPIENKSGEEMIYFAILD